METVAAVMLVLGTALMLVAAIGLIRLRDPLQRMHSATKAGTLGTILVIGGAMVGMETPPIASGTLAILFVTFTLPVAAQMLGRATFLSDTKLTGGEAMEIPELEHLRSRAPCSDGDA